MLKRIIFFITIFLIICFSIPQLAREKASIYLSTKKDIFETNEEFELIIGINNTEVSAYNFEIYFDKDKLDLVTKKDNINEKDGRIICVWYDETGGKNSKQNDIEKINFKAKENGNVNFIIQGEFYNALGELIQTSIETKEINIGVLDNVKENLEESILQKEMKNEKGDSILKNNANLKLLRINKEGLTPSFENDIYKYYLTIPSDVNDLEIACLTENPNATIQISGNENLKEGLNVIDIKTVSEDKEVTKSYEIEVTKTSNLESANTNLETLVIENVLLNPNFNNDILEYNAEVSNNINNLNILAISENENATVEIKGEKNLKQGDNYIEILVTAPNNFTKRKYEILVHKRNEIEEEKYIKEQENLEEKLENAYKIEETSAESTKEEIINTENEIKNSVEIGTYIILIIIFLVVIILLIRYRKNKKSKSNIN